MPGSSSTSLRGVLEGQHDLEKRMARQRASRIKDLDQPLEGQLLMSVSGQIGRAHPGQQAHGSWG